MKTILTAALALAMMGGVASAQPWDGGRHYQGDRYERSDRHDRSGGYGRRDRQDRGYGYRGEQRRWARGDRLPGAYRGYGGVDYRRHHLRRPPSGYRWVRVDDDYVLTAIATGLVLDVISGR